jgi:ammonium transporter, Amt family
MAVVFAGIKYTVGLRVPEDEEIDGLDVVEHGAPGYGPEMLSGGGAAPRGVAGATLAGAGVSR